MKRFLAAVALAAALVSGLGFGATPAAEAGDEWTTTRIAQPEATPSRPGNGRK